VPFDLFIPGKKIELQQPQDVEVTVGDLKPRDPPFTAVNRPPYVSGFGMFAISSARRGPP